MDSSFQGYVLDPAKCRKLSFEAKRDLVRSILECPGDAAKMLKSWGRPELIEILCAEMGKDRKYTGYTKSRIIDLLMKTLSAKKSSKRKDIADTQTSAKRLDSGENQASMKEMDTGDTQMSTKRQRKSEHPTRLPSAANNPVTNSNSDLVKYCQNSACRATLHQEDAYCKRCTCCICQKYDDNKDPSLWLVCSSEPPYESDSCGVSCHLECAMKHERAGISTIVPHRRLEGSFCCVYCGKVNDLLGCWRKQLMVAKDTRRVDVLCYRVSLSQKLLHGTEKYRKQIEFVEQATKMLEVEVGPLIDSPTKMGRGIVNRLPSGPEIQKLCASAIDSLDSMPACSILHHRPASKTRVANSGLVSSGLVRFENIFATSIVVVLHSEGLSSESIVVYNLWHRKADSLEYPLEPTCTLFVPNTRFLLKDLSPDSEYWLKVVPFNGAQQLGLWEVMFKTSSATVKVVKSLVKERNPSPTTNSSSLSNPSEGNESNNIKDDDDDDDDDDDIPEKCSKEMPADSVSVIDEDRTNGEVRSVQNSTNHTEPLRNPTNEITEERAPSIPHSENLSPEDQLVREMETCNRSNSSGREDMVIVPFERGSNDTPPVTPFKPELVQDGLGRSMNPEPNGEMLCIEPDKPEKEFQAGSSSKKTNATRRDEECNRDESPERYAYCVKTIRWLECEGHIEKNFRVKFLTWYSLQATPQERRIVKVFVDTFIDDPVSLAGQLIDTFSERLSNKKAPCVSSTSFCMKLFH